MMPLRLACVLGVTAFFSLVQGCSTATTPPPSEEETGEETPGDDDTEEKKDDEKAADPAAPTTTTPPVVEAPAPPPPVVKSAMTFFVTSVAAGTGGNLGGLAGADTKCKDLAAAAPIKGDDHTWAAYLSVQGTDAKTRIGTGPWTNQKGKVIAAMFYPSAVMTVAVGILALLMIVVVPKFKTIFADLLGGDAGMPGFTLFVLGISDTLKDSTIIFPEWAGGIPLPGPVIWALVAIIIAFKVAMRTKKGQYIWDKVKLKLPVIGSVVSKVAIARFTRTLGTLVQSGVPILQALTIVKETAGNLVVANAVGAVYESVKEGETITAPLEKSSVFPPMVISMVDVGEQTGALPEMLLKIADNYDEEVDNAVTAMTSLLEPIMIVFLAVIVGSIVIALFLPLISLIDQLGSDGGSGD